MQVGEGQAKSRKEDGGFWGFKQGRTCSVVCLRQSFSPLYGIFQREMMKTFLGGGCRGGERCGLTWIKPTGCCRCTERKTKEAEMPSGPCPE